MSIQGNNPDWNSFGRANASQKWRKQSAAMGHDMTRAIVEAADVKRGMRVLDLACGTGEPAISLAELLENSGEVIGVDISPAPLKIAEERALQRGLANARFQQADAHDLPFAADSFDRLTSRLGVMFFSDLQKALREIKRVLKPGGAAILMAWGPMHQQPYFSTTIGTVLQDFLGPLCRKQQRVYLPLERRMFWPRHSGPRAFPACMNNSLQFHGRGREHRRKSGIIFRM
ncbi:MAG TPA: class I SAM-dependent methyltransferase [Candidatus Angelobacter sp.]|nr:class I SAM-dependent methyltransferase [Candidatus Angelobacter sp.]